MSTSKPENSVWKLQNIEADYWHEYIATRPPYDRRIFDPIFKYHAANKSQFKDALDIGTGAGSALGPLLQRFQNVTASDNDTVSLAFAQERYRHIQSSQLSWTTSRGEDLLEHHDPSSFDLVTCALTFPLLDTDKALHTVFTLLRLGGTLAIWFYGPPIFLDASLAEKAQPVLYAALDHSFKPVVSGGDAQQLASWKRAADGMASWLDYIPFSEDNWTNIHRQKWNNARDRLSFFGPAACDFEVEPTSAVSSNEIVINEQDPNFWKIDWDAEMLKRFVLSIFPKPKSMVKTDEILDGHLEKLKELMGGPGVKASMTWPAVLILVRKKT
ncbi:S-adenosyl-L-methionine-dependent methyltransferase [Bimuria novae-zelandiae CBS 107.79]|uniref:S-adenosyl-L-methionine-dependent methyltransferase n=1 Tax=Bimuria novae-zelandiae CBS 107.79 TaxID=1447943 RepID=A0A6A5UZX2_9PLEO|nr:S-adenosyl-L-methionine-dependent methyltransferase [Bimuria novae-zelandiae CBS 107.79]